MNHVAAIISMLHEPAQSSSAVRRFRNKPVLQWTLNRLARSQSTDSMHIFCWEDQEESIREIEAEVICKGPRQALAPMRAVTAARRWADGWRGGLMGACEFDLGFHGPWVGELAELSEADAVLLIDPAAALIDPVLVDQMIQHAQLHPAVELCFSQAAPGLTGALLRRTLIDRLGAAGIHPGRLLSFWPDQFGVDPIGRDGCVATPTPVARSIHRFKLDSHRQILRTDHATNCFNGQLMSTESEELVEQMRGCESVDPLPRDVILELNTSRLSRPIFSPLRHQEISRPDLSPVMAGELFGQLSRLDDVRLTLAGAGDPLNSPVLFEVLAAARSAGIGAIHIETDLLTADAALIARLAESEIDVVSVHLPAITTPTYREVMGVDGCGRVVENIRLLETAIARLGAGTPLIAPIFMKTKLNMAEMDPWYDYWVRRCGHAVIASPSDFAGQIPDVAVADMSPPKRRACGRLGSRMTVLSDGQIVSCEQDVLGKQVMGKIGESSIEDVWRNRFAAIRRCHAQEKWNEHPLCAACREWHRP